MKRDVWLRTNRRAYGLLGLAWTVAVVFFTAGFCGLPSAWASWTSGGLAGLSWIGLVRTLRPAFYPRLAYSGRELLVYLRGVEPIAVPIEIVECFFLGQGASFLPRALEGRQGEAAETATIVVRLAEAARDWSHRDVRPSFGQWCEGYITIRGTWCEPINQELVGRLNQHLIAAHRALRQKNVTTVPV